MQCSVKHLRFQLWCESLSPHPILNSLSMRRISVAGKQKNWGRKQFHLCSESAVSSLCCQGWSCKTMWRLSFCLIQWKALLPLLQPRHRNSKPRTEDDYFITLFYTCSLGVCLCNKNNHTDNVFSRQTPLWSSFFIPPSWCTFIHFNYCPICSTIPRCSGTLTEPWPHQDPCIQDKYH